MSLLPDAWLVLQRDAAVLLAFAACMLIGGALTAGVVHFCAADGLDFADQFSLAAGGWIMPILPLALVLLRAPALTQGRVAVVVAMVVTIAVGGLWLFRSRPMSTPQPLTPSVWMLTGIFLALIPIRLAFVAALQLPLYFDSAEHYQIAASLLQQFAAGGVIQRFVWPVTGYYHLGYHV